MNRLLLTLFLTFGLVGLTACSGGAPKPKPTPLQAIATPRGVKQVWSARLGEVKFPLQVRTLDDQVLLANSTGSVVALNAQSGKELWRVEIGEPLSAGVGSDGKVAAVVTQENELVALSVAKILWRAKLTAQAYTAPLVAGERVFVLAADRSVSAFDAQTGAKLWQQTRTNEPLVLSQGGVILAVGDTLVVGLSARLVGLDPMNGNSRWELAFAAPRGINDIERLADLLGPASRVGNSVCARAFQASVACANAQRGNLMWTKPAHGLQSVHGDAQWVVGTESNGKVVAWQRADGEVAWTVDSLRYRGLSAPLLIGHSLAIGDSEGWVHFLAIEDGALVQRLPTDGSAIAIAPVLADRTVVVVTTAGGVYGFVPE